MELTYNPVIPIEDCKTASDYINWQITKDTFDYLVEEFPEECKTWDEDDWDDKIAEYDDDSRSELRESGTLTDICPDTYSRHYEVHVCALEIGGKFIGFNYWYGGGKWGEPESVEWVDDAFFVDRRVEVREIEIFTRIEEENGTEGEEKRS